MRSSDPEASLSAMGATATKHILTAANGGNVPVYRVTDCPKHDLGGLPRMAEVKREPVIPPEAKKKYDLSCPHCGNTAGIKIAWNKVLRPEEWYCRCGACNKSFKPRKRGLVVVESAPVKTKEDEIPDENKGKRGKPYSKKGPCQNRVKFDAAITKEAYLDGVGRGLSDYKILKEVGLSYHTYKKYLNRSKRDWGLGEDFNIKRKGTENVVFETVPKEKKEKEEGLTIAQLIDLHDELEEEIKNLDELNGPESGVRLVKSLRLLLDERRCATAQKLKKVHDAFENTRVEI
jgi:hypothetical protein